ncbi:MAG: hypothetical protein IJJ29_02270 [Solobacterium sp.]|nr:hypothetical protein [Solobacterium sp.]
MQVTHTIKHNYRFIWKTIIFSTFICCLSFLFNKTVMATTESTIFTIDNSNTVLEIIVPNTLKLDLKPYSGVEFGSVQLPVSAGTNNPYGLTLTMTTPNLNLTNSNITLSENPNNIVLDEDSHPVIQNLADGTYTESNFTTNHWGYKLSTASDYLPMPSTLELLSTESAGNAITTIMDLAAKVDTTMPIGAYSTAINFIAVGNVAPVVGETWYFNNSVAYYGSDTTFKIDYSIICGDPEYDMNDGTELTFYTDTQCYPGGPRYSLKGSSPEAPSRCRSGYDEVTFYNLLINTSNASSFSGGHTFWSIPNAIYSGGSTSNMTETSDSSPTYVTGIMITGGEDFDNPDFRTWLEANATKQ